MSVLPLKSPTVQAPRWWRDVRRILATIILGPDRRTPRPALPDTVELARDGKISDWLRID